MRILKMSAGTLFLFGIVMMTFLCCFSSQVHAEQEGDFTYTVIDGQAQVTGYTGVGEDVTIPDTLGGAIVTSIGNAAFQRATSWPNTSYDIKSIHIPESVTSIGSYAFDCNMGLTSLNLPQGLTTIGNNAFQNLRSVSTITIPEGVKRIENQTFYNCYSLTSINIPQNIESIGSGVFVRCYSLMSITADVGNQNFSSRDGVLYDKADTTLVAWPGGLSEAKIPDGVTNIGDSAFISCTGITSIVLPDSVTSIGDGAFNECTGLTVLNLPLGLKSIGIGAFGNCTGLTMMSIPQGITSVSDQAFYYCTGLKSIELPESITNIGSDAFSFCTSLTSINLPQGLISIGNSAFRRCSALTNITLPEGLTTIGDAAFWECTGFTSIKIPESVTSINNYIFMDCSYLTNISLPESLTKIGDSAFHRCNRLTSINIPQKVTSIGIGAFVMCTGLTRISIPESVQVIGERAFQDCFSLQNIRFNSATTQIGIHWLGWYSTIPTTTTIIGYAPSTAKDYAAKYGNPFQDITTTIDVLTNAQVIAVKDFDTKQPVSDVSVSFAGKNVTTDSDGRAIIEPTATGYQLLSMIGSGYCDYETNLKVSLGNADVFYLRKDTDAANPHVSMINLNDGSTYYDLFKEEKDYAEITSDGDITDKDKSVIEMKANWKGKTPEKYLLTQDGRTVMESTTGTFDKKALGRLFKPESKIYAMVKAADETVSKAVETGIRIKTPSLSGTMFGEGGGSGELRLGNKMGVTIPGNMPVISGTKIDFGIDVIPATLSVTPDSFKIAVGIPELSDPVEDDEATKEKWKEFKKSIDEARNFPSKGNRLKNLKDYFKPKQINMPITSGWEPQADMVGYIEGTIVNGQPVITSSTLIMNAGATYSLQTQYVIGPIPVVMEVGEGLDVELMGEIARVVPESGEMKLKTELTITPSFELGAGVGIANVATVIASGKAEMPLLTRFTDNYQKLSLTGSMSIKAKALIFEAESEIARGTWTIAQGFGDMNSMDASEAESPQKSFNIYDASQYTLMSRDYTQNPTEWTGGGGTMSTQSTDYTNQTLNGLQTNLYPNAQPKMAVIGDKQVMVWLADNISRSAANRTMLVYSIYDKTAGIWSAPLPARDDSTADFYPQIASDGNSLYVTWQNSKTTFSDTVTLTEAAKAGEIAVSKFNTATQSFDIPTTLTSNDNLDTQPQVAVSGDKAGVVWTSNSENDLFGITGRNTINLSELNGSTWSAPQTLVSDQNVIPSLCLGYTDNQATAAFTVDSDNDLGTIDDRDLFTAKPGENVTRLTSDTTMDSNPVFAGMNGTDSLFWYKDGNIVYTPASDLRATPGKVFAENKQGFGDAFNIINNPAGKTAAIWTETKDEMAEIHGAIYDQEKSQWSDDIQISNIGSKIQFPNGIFDANGNFSIAFNRQTTKEDTSQQSDLCVLNVVPSYNLTLNSVSFNDEAIIPNTALPIEMEVTNNGQLPVDQIIVDVLDGETSNTSNTLTESLQPGETKTLATTLTLPETITRKDYTVRVTPAAGNEYNLTDNTQIITLGYTDLSLSIEKYNVGDARVIMAQVKNISAVPTDAIITVHEDTLDGNVLFTKTIKDIKQNENIFETIDLDPNALSFTGNIKQIYVSVAASAEETSTGDNSDFIVLENPVQTEATLQSIAISTPASKLRYKVGETLDITGLVVTGTYSDGTTKDEPITPDNITGFDSAKAAVDQVLTITVNGITTTYTVQIANPILLGDVDGNGQIQAFDALMALQIATGKKQGTLAELDAADVESSGNVEAFDALRILQYATGKITEF